MEGYSGFFARLAARHTNSIEFVFQQPALDRPVEKNNAARRFKPYALCESQVAGKDPGRPAFPVLFESVAYFTIEGLKFNFFANAFAVRWIADQCAMGCRRLELGKIAIKPTDLCTDA